MKFTKRFSKINDEQLLKIDSWFVGLNISSGVNKLEASLLGTNGVGNGASIVLSKSVSFDLPPEIVQVYSELQRDLGELCQNDDSKSADESSDDPKSKLLGRKKESIHNGSEKANDKRNALSLPRLSELRTMISSVEEEAFNELLNFAGVRKDKIVAVTVNDPGLWLRNSFTGGRTCFELSDAYALAKRIQVNVVDSLISDENKTSRQNALLTSYWTLLGNFEHSKLLVDLGETARWYFIPSRKDDPQSWKRLRFNETTPCGSLLNALTKLASKGENDVDLGGKYSVQGRCVNELLNSWRIGLEEIAKNVDACPKKWFSVSTNSVNETFYIEKLLKCEPKASWVDALCTSVHWIGEQICESVASHAANFDEQPLDVVLMGGGKQNGLLFNKLSAGLGNQTLHSLDEYGAFQEDAFEATATALLGMFVLIGKPVGIYDDSGLIETSMGRLTWGTADSVRKLARFQNGN